MGYCYYYAEKNVGYTDREFARSFLLGGRLLTMTRRYRCGLIWNDVAGTVARVENWALTQEQVTGVNLTGDKFPGQGLFLCPYLNLQGP